MKLEKLEYDPDVLLKKAIQLWCGLGGDQPSRVDSHVDCDTWTVYLRNVNGPLATYRPTADGKLRRRKEID